MKKIIFILLLSGLLMSSAGTAAEETWITIDPIQQPEIGEPYIITGSTNIPADTAIVLKIYRYEGTLPTPDRKEMQNLPAVFSYTMVVGGEEAVRSWTVEGPMPQTFPAGNARYIAAANLMYSPDTILAAEHLPEPPVWADVAAIPDRPVGNAVRISGTTNIPAGGTVSMEVRRVAESYGAFSPVYDELVFSQDAPVTAEEGGVNTWSVAMNTKDYPPGIYSVTLKNILHQTGPRFQLESSQKIEPWWITFDPLDDQPVGEPLVISGATNLAAGTTLDIVIKSSTLLVTGPDYPKAFTGTTVVREGNAGVNFWSVAAEIQSKYEDQYAVSITDPKTGTKALEYVNLYSPETVGRKVSRMTMNEVRDPKTGEQYVFSGSTTAPAGSIVIVDVGKITSTITGNAGDIFSLPRVYEASGVVIAGEHGINHWAIQSALAPDRLAEPNVRYAAAAFMPEMPKMISEVRTISGSGTWATVDAIADAVTGNRITISGTTNLAPGEQILVEVYAVGWGSSPKKPEKPVYSGETTVGKGSVWSTDLDTAGLRMGKYTVVAAGAPYLSGQVFSLEIPKDRIRIDVNPVPLVTQNSTFTLSGTTGLDDGFQLLVEILPKYFVDEVFAHDPKACYSGPLGSIATTTKIEKGEGDTNIWSVPVDTRNWKVDTYVVKVMGIEVEAVAPRTEFELYAENYTPPTATEPQTNRADGFVFIPVLFTIMAAAILFAKR